MKRKINENDSENGTEMEPKASPIDRSDTPLTLPWAPQSTPGHSWTLHNTHGQAPDSAPDTPPETQPPREVGDYP